MVDKYSIYIKTLEERYPKISASNFDLKSYYKNVFSDILEYEQEYINNLILTSNRKNHEEYWFNLNGNDFEVEIGNLYKRLGFKVERTQLVGDGGIDVKLWNSDDEYIVVQCKNHKNTVGPSIVRDLYGVMISENAQKAILICSGGFTVGVYNFVKDKPIELIDISGILALSKKINPIRDIQSEIKNYSNFNDLINHHIKQIAGVTILFSHYKRIELREGKSYYADPIDNEYCLFENKEAAQIKVEQLKTLANKICLGNCIYDIAEWKLSEYGRKNLFYIRVLNAHDSYLISKKPNYFNPEPPKQYKRKYKNGYYSKKRY